LAKSYPDWTKADWENVYFADETKVNLFYSDGVRWVWRRPGEALKEECVVPTIKHGGGSVMLWGGIAHSVPASVQIIEGKFKAKIISRF